MTNGNLDIERLNRFLKGNFSESDSEYLKNIFCDKNKEEELEHIVRKQWYELLKDNKTADKNLDHVLYKIHYELNTKNNQLKQKSILKNIIIWSSRIAAIIILPVIMFTGIMLDRKNDKDNLTWVELHAPAWTRVQFSLPDGSTGWLNGSSSIKYKCNFTKERKIALEGEAFFNVKTDPEIPFIVGTQEIIVTASGTKFNIASYRNENNVEVVLEEGKLKVDNKEMTSSFTMSPKDLIVYDKSINRLSKEVVDPQKYVSWTEGKLVFRNDPIDVIARRLGRWYNVDVEISGNNFEDVKLRATFVDENLEEVLYFLKRALPLDYKIINGKFKADDGIYAKKKILINMRK